MESKPTRVSQEDVHPCKDEDSAPLYRVVIANDDFTPMDFVVEVLQGFFGLQRHMAIQTMLQVHASGQGSCGVFTHDVAESKIAQVQRYAKKYEYPLYCTMEQV